MKHNLKIVLSGEAASKAAGGAIKNLPGFDEGRTVQAANHVTGEPVLTWWTALRASSKSDPVEVASGALGCAGMWPDSIKVV